MFKGVSAYPLKQTKTSLFCALFGALISNLNFRDTYYLHNNVILILCKKIDLRGIMKNKKKRKSEKEMSHSIQMLKTLDKSEQRETSQNERERGVTPTSWATAY
jgi:hypothetical protein